MEACFKDIMICDQIINSMADSIIRQKVMIQKEMTKHDLIAFIAAEEMCKKEMPTYSSDSYLEVNATSTYKQQGRAKRAPQQQQQKSQDQWCDHCKTNGHPHDHCFKTNACRRCRQKGHVERECTNRPRQSNNAVSRRVVFSLTVAAWTTTRRTNRVWMFSSKSTVRSTRSS